RLYVDYMSHSNAERTIESKPPVSLRRMHEGNPVLEPDPSHPWESRVVLNPAASYIAADALSDSLCMSWGLTENQVRRLRSEGGACVMIYRAQGDVDRTKDFAASSLGLAVFTPHLDLVARLSRPVIEPEAPFHNLGAEDPRLTRV